MNEFEAASFYGDYSLLQEVYAEMLSENFDAPNTPETFSLPQAPRKQTQNFVVEVAH